jgi:glycosyltransferase involved in cell wall biosynthesis
MPDPYLTIVVPAYNEARRIGPSLEAITTWAGASTRAVEVIVVDDGSSDGTAQVARAALGGYPAASILSNGTNRGKGYSIRRGVLAARGQVVLVSDADLSTPIEEADLLMSRLTPMGRGIVIGSRALSDSRVEVHQNPMRELMGKVFNRVVRLLTGLPFHDTQCGFKLMTRGEVAPIFEKARIDGFSYDVELLYVAVRRGIPVAEVGVTWRNAPGSKVGMLSDPLRMLRDVWRVRRWYARGRYEVKPDG